MGAARNDQVHRARGPMGLTIEQPRNVKEGEGVENPEVERTPVQRLVIRHFAVSTCEPVDPNLFGILTRQPSGHTSSTGRHRLCSKS